MNIIPIEQAEVRSRVLLFMCIGEQNWRRGSGAGEHLSRFGMQECLRIRLSACRRHQGSRTIREENQEVFEAYIQAECRYGERMETAGARTR